MNYAGKFADEISYQVKIKKLYPDVQIPKYAHEGDAGFDLIVHNFKEVWGTQDHIGEPSYLKCTEDTTMIRLLPHYRILVGMGYALEIPRGLQLEIRGRSGNSLKKGLVLAHGVGTIDSGFRGEIAFIALNTSDFAVEIRLRERIGQAILMPYYIASFTEVEELSETKRGTGGFGSTT